MRGRGRGRGTASAPRAALACALAACLALACAPGAALADEDGGDDEAVAWLAYLGADCDEWTNIPLDSLGELVIIDNGDGTYCIDLYLSMDYEFCADYDRYIGVTIQMGPSPTLDEGGYYLAEIFSGMHFYDSGGNDEDGPTVAGSTCTVDTLDLEVYVCVGATDVSAGQTKGVVCHRFYWLDLAAAAEALGVVKDYDGFKDVQDSSAYWYDAVYSMTEAGYVTGETDAWFGVEDALTRAQMVTILWRIACPEEYAAYGGDYGSAESTAFADVPDGAYYTAAVEWAYGEGVVDGVSDGAFDPGAECTFEQFCTVLARYAAGRDCIDSLDEDYCYSILHDMQDAGDISGWARAAVAWCMDNGLVNGTGGRTIGVGDDLVRGRAVTVLWRAVEAGLLA